MSRAMNVRMPLAEVRTRCDKAKARISAIEELPSGHTHVVLVTSEDAETMRGVFGSRLILTREPRFPYASLRAPR